METRSIFSRLYGFRYENRILQFEVWFKLRYSNPKFYFYR